MNTGSGSRSERDKERLEGLIALAFKKHGVAATIEFVEGAALRENLEASFRAADRGDVDAIAVGGGDGTLRTAASVLAGSMVPLGILPLGTLNHFAKDLKIPLSLAEAVEVIVGGQVTDIDLGEVNGMTFINNSSIGIYPYMVLDRERRRRGANLSKWPAMVLAAFRVFKNLPLRRLSIHRQGSTEIVRTPCVLIGNNAYRSDSRSFASRATLSEGKLYVYVAKRESRRALLFLALRIIVGRLDQSRDLRIISTTAVTIRSRRKRLLVACDGEVEFIRTPLNYRTRPMVLKVLTPVAAVETK